MVLGLFRFGMAAVAAAAIWAAVVPSANAATRTDPDLFYNYYVPPVGGGVGAQMYISPRPTPPLVGHTWVTYQPLMPHEFLYTHHRCYRTAHPDAPATRTRVTWGHAVVPNLVPRYVDGKILTHLFDN